MKNGVFYNRLIMDTLEDAGHEVVAFSGNSVTATINQFKVQISHERCSCHGGRLSISADHCGFYKRLELAEYDESKGITDADSELEYHIKTEMIPIASSLKDYLYACEHTSRWSPEKKDYSYYKSIEELTNRITGGGIKDIFTLSEPLKRKYPNPDIYEMIVPVKYENGIMEIVVNRFDKNIEQNKADTYRCYVFNKLRK